MSILETIKRVKEDKDPFDSADPADIKARKDKEVEAKKSRIKAWEKEHGKKLDHCPHCDADLRDTGVYIKEVVYNTVDYYYDEHYGWQWGDSSGDSDNEVEGYFCSECSTELGRGEDFDFDI